MSRTFSEILPHVVPYALFFLPRPTLTRLERWLRGREEFHKLRMADCVVVSWGKSGRTWFRLMLSRFYQTTHGLPDGSFLEFDNLHAIRPQIPKVFFTHGNYLRDYTGNWDSKADFRDRKVLLLVRDPRDVAVSQFFQWKFRMRPAKKVLNDYPAHGADLSIFEFVMNHDAGLGRIVDFFNGWARELPLMHDMMVIRYEDMRRDPEGVLRDVVAFLGTPGTEAAVKDAVAFAAYENMKKLEEDKAFAASGRRLRPGDRDNPESFKVRRAKVGGYRDYFDDDQILRIDAFVRDTLSPVFGYHDVPSVSEAAARVRTATT